MKPRGNSRARGRGVRAPATKDMGVGRERGGGGGGVDMYSIHSLPLFTKVNKLVMHLS